MNATERRRGAAYTRLMIQYVYPNGKTRWKMEGPVGGNEWTRTILIEQLEKALAFLKSAKDE